MHVAVLTGALAGLWQVAVVWGLGISLAIYALGSVSGAHMNPAMTAAFATYRGFPLKKVPAYVLAQLTGAVAAAATLYGLFHGLILRFEQIELHRARTVGQRIVRHDLRRVLPEPGDRRRERRLRSRASRKARRCWRKASARRSWPSSSSR